MIQEILPMSQAMTDLRAALEIRPRLPQQEAPARELPEGSRMFFGIGAQKAGTTWLYDFLSRNPACHFSRNKELHYFDVRVQGGGLIFDMRLRHATALAARLASDPAARNEANFKTLQELTALLATYTGPMRGPERHRAYLDYLLEGCSPGQTACDITPAYAILDRRTFADMASIGAAKFLFLMRDPVARMWSQVRMAVGTRKLPDDELPAACAAHAQALIDTGRLLKIERADYVHTMAELEAAVPAERIMYVFYEDLFRQETADEICAWLGVPSMPAETGRRVNEGTAVAIPPEIAAAFSSAFAPQYQAIEARFGAAMPEAWRRNAPAPAPAPAPVAAG